MRGDKGDKDRQRGRAEEEMQKRGVVVEERDSYKHRKTITKYTSYTTISKYFVFGKNK